MSPFILEVNMKLLGTEKLLGKFNIDSNALIIGDPCYSPETWCLGDCLDVLNGEWIAKILEADDSLTGFGDRNSALFAFNKDYINDVFKLDDIDLMDFANDGYKDKFKLDYIVGILGVDSGQAGIYDFKHFMDVKKSDNEEAWYWQNCDVTLHNDMAGILPDKKGCVSSSGYGDGGYDYYCFHNEKGNTVAILIVFIEEEEIVFIEEEECTNEQ